MVRSIKIFSLIMLLLVGWSCNDDDDDDVPTPQPSLDAPTGVATSNVTENSFDVSWNAVTDADSYTFQVSTDNGFGSFVVNQSGVSTTTGSVSGLDAETEYFVRVSASNTEVTSDFSSVVSVTTNAEPVTGPTNPTTTEASINGTAFAPSVTEGKTSSDGKTQLVFSDGTSTITLTTTADAAGTFSISAGGDHTATFMVNDSVFTATSGTIEVTEYAATASGTYEFDADYAFTNGRLLETVSITGGSFAGVMLSAADAIDAPSVEVATDITDTGFTANWTAVANAVAYFVDVASDDSFTDLIIDGEEVLGTSLPVADLDAGTDYFVRVRATDGLTTSENSAAGAVSTSGSSGPEPTDIEAPVAAAASNITADGFTANWSAVDGATQYIIEVASDNAYTTFVLTDESSTTSYDVSGLDAETMYYYRVRATDGTNNSENSNSITVTTSADETPGGGGDGDYIIEVSQTGPDQSSTTVISYNDACQAISAVVNGTASGFSFSADATYEYDSQGRLILVSSETSGITTTIEYNGFSANGFPEQVVVGNSFSGDITYDYNFDSQGRVESITGDIVGQTVTYTYTYDGDNVATVEQSGSLGSGTITFEYNSNADNFYLDYLEQGVSLPEWYLPYASSQDLITGYTSNVGGTTTEVDINYEFNANGNPTQITTTTTSNGETSELVVAYTYSDTCN